jgi:hypothetical protein
MDLNKKNLDHLLQNKPRPTESLPAVYCWILKTGALIYQIRRQNREKKIKICKGLCFLCLRNAKLVDGHIISSAILKRMGFREGVNSKKDSISTPESQFWQEKIFCQNCDGTLIGNNIENRLCEEKILEGILGLSDDPEVEVHIVDFGWEPNGKNLYLYATSLALRIIHHQLARGLEIYPEYFDRIAESITQMRSILQTQCVPEKQKFWVFYNVTSKYAKRSLSALNEFLPGAMICVPFALDRQEERRILFLCIVRIRRITIVIALNPLEDPHILRVFNEVFDGFTPWTPEVTNSIVKSSDFPGYFAEHTRVFSEIKLDELLEWQQRNALKRWKYVWQNAEIRIFVEPGYSFDRDNQQGERLSWPDVKLIKRQDLNNFGYDFNYALRLPSGKEKYIITRFQPDQSLIFVIDATKCPSAFDKTQNFEWVRERIRESLTEKSMGKLTEEGEQDQRKAEHEIEEGKSAGSGV